MGNFGPLYNGRAHDPHNRSGDKLYPLDGNDKYHADQNTQNGVLLAQNSIQIREFKNSVDSNGKVLKNTYEVRQPYVVDFITKAVPQYDSNPYRGWLSPNITVGRDGNISVADHKRLDGYSTAKATRGRKDAGFPQ